MMRTDEQVPRGNRHVLRQLSLNRKVRLICIRVFKVFVHRQREGQNWSKAWERLIIKALAPELILRACGRTRRQDTGWADRISACCRADGSLKNLGGVQQSGR